MFLYNPGLKKKLRDAIKTRLLSAEEIAALYAYIKRDYVNRKKALKISAFTLGPFVLLLGAFFCIADFSFSTLVTCAVLCAILLLVGVYAKVNLVDKNRNQFVKALAEGYPELLEEYGMASFEEN